MKKALVFLFSLTLTGLFCQAAFAEGMYIPGT